MNKPIKLIYSNNPNRWGSIEQKFKYVCPKCKREHVLIITTNEFKSCTHCKHIHIIREESI
jgi:DNA-directed RNA polymerase subunit RPC12/RpoP